VGDRLLIQVAERLTGIAGPDGFVARLGGDELAVLVYGDLEEAKAVAARVIDAIARPFRIDGLVVSVGCSIGMCCTDETRDTTELMQFSDLALYEAKRHGRGRWICYTRGMLDAVTERVRLGADIAASRA
jgi:diguanylate cyclase (GGDEF)-like protein